MMLYCWVFGKHFLICHGLVLAHILSLVLSDPLSCHALSCHVMSLVLSCPVPCKGSPKDSFNNILNRITSFPIILSLSEGASIRGKDKSWNVLSQ